MAHSPAYTTYQKIEDDVTLRELLTIIPVSDSNGKTIIPATVDTDRIDRIIETVANEIDGYIGQRYTVPLTNQDHIDKIEWIARAKAICQFFTPEAGGPEWRQELCQKATKILEEIASGDKEIPDIEIKDSKSAKEYNPYESDDLGGYDSLERPYNWPDQSWNDNCGDSSFLRSS
jgi:phage gp36-like protein